MKEVFENFKKLPIMVQIAIIVAIIILLYYAWIKLKATKDIVDRTVRDKTEGQVLTGLGINESYSSNKYEGWANDLERFMTGVGTDTEEVYDLFTNMKNDADILALERAFGLRLSASTEFWVTSWFADPSDLADWLHGDLGSSGVEQLNKQLDRQGITKNF